ncbi:MAG: hypothetical protein HQL04_05345 [Nitrospirae bacterium]|nr:hypothetical protein [Nitrospirota bacterium]
MAVTLPIEVYEALEKTMEHEDAKRVVKAFETTISDLTEYKWKTSKDELLSEMEKRFATKSDLALIKAELKADLSLLQTKLESKMLLYFLILIFVIILTNSKALEMYSPATEALKDNATASSLKGEVKEGVGHDFPAAGVGKGLATPGSVPLAESRTRPGHKTPSLFFSSTLLSG